MPHSFIPGASLCLFQLFVQKRRVSKTKIDPRSRPAPRRWWPFHRRRRHDYCTTVPRYTV